MQSMEVIQNCKEVKKEAESTGSEVQILFSLAKFGIYLIICASFLVSHFKMENGIIKMKNL